MARYIDEAALVKAIVRERDKIPLKVPCAPYELLDERPNAFGQAQRSGIRIALKCVSEAPTADVAPKSEVEELLTRLNTAYEKIDMAEDDVERLEQENEALKDTNEHLAVLLAEAKSEVEQFPCVAYNKKHERYQVIHKGKDGRIFASKFHHTRKDAEIALAELKKKYTEQKE